MKLSMEVSGTPIPTLTRVALIIYIEHIGFLSKNLLVENFRSFSRVCKLLPFLLRVRVFYPQTSSRVESYKCRPWSQKAGIESYSSCVTLEKSLPVSVPQFLLCKVKLMRGPAVRL